MRYGLSIAALDPQWIGIAAAMAILIVLVIILLVRRARSGAPERAAPASAVLTELPVGGAPGAAPQPASFAAAAAYDSPPAWPDTPPPSPGSTPAVGAPQSFLDQPLQGGFEGLGRPAGGQPALGTVVMPRDSRPVAGAAADPLAPRPDPPVPPPMDMGMDMGSLAPETLDTPIVDTPIAAGVPVGPPDAAATPDGVVSGWPPDERLPEMPETAPEAAPVPAGPPAIDPQGEAAAPLSDIIVTTNKAEIDLTDPDVRAMLEELVHDEIALAEAYREQGQTLDAILQLTEAEKACTALGDAEQARHIKALLDELQG